MSSSSTFRLELCIICSECKKVFKSAQLLKAHKVSEHGFEGSQLSQQEHVSVPSGTLVKKDDNILETYCRIVINDDPNVAIKHEPLLDGEEIKTESNKTIPQPNHDVSTDVTFEVIPKVKGEAESEPGTSSGDDDITSRSGDDVSNGTSSDVELGNDNDNKQCGEDDDDDWAQDNEDESEEDKEDSDNWELDSEDDSDNDDDGSDSDASYTPNKKKVPSRPKCRICFKTFGTAAMLKKHSPCPLSLQNIDDKDSDFSGIRVKTESNDMDSETADAMKEEEIKQMKLKCKLCSHISNCAKEQRNHCKEAHGTSFRRSPTTDKPRKRIKKGEKSRWRSGDEEGSFKCAHCPNSYDRPDKRFVHEMEMHIQNMRLRCKLCGHISNCSKARRNHRKEAHGIVSNPNPTSSSVSVHCCTMCPRKYTVKYELKKHMRRHTGERPHKCSYCPQAFGHKGHLTQHERIHRNDRPYACSHCPKRFYKRSHLTLHERSHTGEKPYLCDVCGEAFASGSGLKAHERTYHTRKKPFKCSKCSKSFIHQGLRQVHEIEVHNLRIFRRAKVARIAKTSIKTTEATHVKVQESVDVEPEPEMISAAEFKVEVKYEPPVVKAEIN